MIRRTTAASSVSLRQRHSLLHQQHEWVARWKVLLIALPSFLLGTSVSLFWEFGSWDCVCPQSPRHATGLAQNNHPLIIGETAQRMSQAMDRRRASISNENNVVSNNETSYTNHAAIDKNQKAAQKAPPSNQQRIQSPDNARESTKDDVDEEEDDDYITVPPNAIFTQGLASMIAGAVVTPKSNFTTAIDLGVPLDELDDDVPDDVLVLYSIPESMPNSLQDQAHQQTSPLPRVLDSATALENCEILQVALVDHSASKNQCLALVPQYEAYHILKYMRLSTSSKTENKDNDDDSIQHQPLQLVSRGVNSHGASPFVPPNDAWRREAWAMLRKYLSSHERVLADVRAVINQHATPYRRALVVMVCNWGQSELLLNFVCHAQSRGMDLACVLVFATDEQTKALAEGLGLAVYYDRHVRMKGIRDYDICDNTMFTFSRAYCCLLGILDEISQQNFEDTPSEAAKQYMDRNFMSMMIAKVLCIHVVSSLRYDFVFQDVDIVWYRHPLRDYFAKEHHWSESYDMVFQDDGAHTLRYAPYSANSGFYYIRHNRLTRHFVDTLLTTGSFMIYQWKSHQQVLIAILSEFVSLYGLKVKVVSREDNDMPGGYHWNADHNFMKAMFRGDVEPLIFHMSWTKNKDIKIQYFQQMNAWHVLDSCRRSSNATALANTDQNNTATIQSCCSAEPLFQCHYGDKPSFQPCRDSLFIDQNGKSFW